MSSRFAVAIFAVIALAGALSIEADPKTIPAEARRAYQEFWAKLPAGESAALARELDRVERLARRDKPVDGDLSTLRARYPELATLETSLAPVRWIAAESPGRAYVCTGMLIIGRNGRARCIGALKRIG